MPLITQLEQLAPTRVATALGAVQFRRACSPGYDGAVTHVLLHGIGSASASWLAQLLHVRLHRHPPCHLLAWDAPGYGASDALPMASPDAGEYAARLWAWLDSPDVAAGGPVTLVGHSLGALMAARAAVQKPQRVTRLVLLAPAGGYARASAERREQKLSERLAKLERLGPAGMARERAGAMLSANASHSQLAFVEHVMAGVDPHGYTQAAHMLAGGDLLADLRLVRCPATIASGSADGVTPSAGCQALARDGGAHYVSLGPVGHICALEAAPLVNRLIGIDNHMS